MVQPYQEPMDPSLAGTNGPTLPGTNGPILPGTNGPTLAGTNGTQCTNTNGTQACQQPLANQELWTDMSYNQYPGSVRSFSHPVKFHFRIGAGCNKVYIKLA